MKRIRNEIALVLLHQLGAIPGNRFLRVELVARIPNSRNKFAVGNAFDVKGQISDAGVGHAVLLLLEAIRRVSPNVPETGSPRKAIAPTADGLETPQSFSHWGSLCYNPKDLGTTYQ